MQLLRNYIWKLDYIRFNYSGTNPSTVPPMIFRDSVSWTLQFNTTASDTTGGSFEKSLSLFCVKFVVVTLYLIKSMLDSITADL